MYIGKCPGLLIYVQSVADCLHNIKVIKYVFFLFTYNINEYTYFKHRVEIEYNYSEQIETNNYKT